MQMLVQLNTADLPEGTDYGSGLIQLFYCMNETPHCEVDCEAFFPFARSVFAQLVPISGPGTVPDADVDDAFPALQITNWEALDDYPNPEEADEMGVSLDDQAHDALGDAELPHRGDKLGGWPAWVQGVEYPERPDCGTPMRLVLQIDSEDHIPYMWGDVGCGHLTQCPEHKERLGFGWACG